MTSLPPTQAGPLVALSEQIVKGKTKVDRLSDVKSLNCWGQDLADVSILSHMPNVEVLSLSVNRISSLKDFSQCLKLQELYLRKNEVAEVDEVRWLVQLPDLHVLWLSDNPCADVLNYRRKVLQLLPRLTKLDNDDVTSQERSNAEDKPDVCQTVSKVPPASPGPLPAQDTPAMASPALGLNPALEQVHMPADLQAALEPFPVPAGVVSCVPSPLHISASAALPSPTPEAPLQRLPASFNAQERLPSRSRSKLSPNSDCSSNVLYAVIALLGDLDQTSLQIVQAEVEQRLMPP